MSAFGPKRTWASALQMSAFGGKADMTLTSKCPAHGQGEHRQYPIDCPLLPWRESEDMPRIEHRREPPEAATCSNAVKADSRQRGSARLGPRHAKRLSKSKSPLSHA